MTVYFAQAFSLQLYKSKKETLNNDKNIPNPDLRYFINHSEISFMSDSLEKIRDWVKSDSCDWIEGCYYTHAVIFKAEEGYMPGAGIIEFYDIDDLDSPSKNWRFQEDRHETGRYIYKNREGEEIALEGNFGLDGVWQGYKDDYEFLEDEEREDEIIFVDPETGEELGYFTNFPIGEAFAQDDDDLTSDED